MIVSFTTHIELNDRGVAWIGGTKVKVTEVVLDKMAYGWSPEEIHFQHPHLSLAQVHAALMYGSTAVDCAQDFSGIIYSHQLRITMGQMVEDVELIVRTTFGEEWRGRIEYLPIG